ncbi:pyridoxal-phosphate dependent enzyme [Streptomyces sp. SID8361]|nr:pyridoxal-phosphate dependent enzyme [Streptomyces sp. SID8361]
MEEITGQDVVLKLENMQRAGAYKTRGAASMMARLPAVERGAGVVAAAAGNHAQGVALAARRLGLLYLIVMPQGASWPKVMATRSFAATVELRGQTSDESLEVAHAIAADTGAAFAPPFDHPDVICGQATVGAELFARRPELDTVVVPMGGGLISGVTAAEVHHHASAGRQVRIV